VAIRVNFPPFQNFFVYGKKVVSMPSGGKRPGAGRPRKALTARIEEGLEVTSHKPPRVLDYPEKSKNQTAGDQKSKLTQLPTFLEMASKEGGDNLPSATEIYEQTRAWVADAGCERYVPGQLMEDFAFTRRSYLEAEYMNKKLGRVMKDGKVSPYVRSALEYLKATTTLYREIQSIVAQNATADYQGNKPNEFLLMLQNRGF
jgi:hypothetical protein